MEVRSFTVEAKEHLQRQGLPGTVNPADQAIIASKLMGTVAQADVDIGQRVSEGELLITLSAGEIEAQVEQAEARLAQLTRNLEREKALLAQRATTAESVRTLEDEIRLAQARLLEVQTMESYISIRAPYDGIITTKKVRRGDLAIPGVPLLTIEGIGSLEVHVQVPDSLMPLPYGAEVNLMAKGIPEKARLVEWSPAADPASRTRLAKLELPEETTLRSGQYVRVDWPVKTTLSIWIPESALSLMGQMERIFTIEDGRAELRLIKSGLRENSMVQVLAGLEAGEQVVMSPTRQLKDGQQIIVTP
ncbi:efflux RND transporter periplasmic adaptor subunit [Puniceicoccales bacterium CK1056]|uniref:Efflux RND transporter periplasmic adaptor subunit n=1 Tax=Oceanipulchritudo coccoides TaxID=2706888 RepID=A0A6B2LYG9_9BACT|nr:efflux RND transporter periplasmic adaptor subunit [Oceanipulchritudo coccoides]NDV61628.1 efflux RND transporter periplasmic adaptor subunit [Oceanipulchritudo coccoides]